MDGSGGPMATDPVRHALLIEPDGVVRDVIARWKSRFAAKWPAARYVTHPPHATLWFGEVSDGPAIRADLAHAAATVSRFVVPVGGACVLSEIASGGTTYVLGAERVERLALLQRRLADTVARYRGPIADIELPATFDRAEFHESWRRYGFPFVGDHWIPHFSVAALEPGDEAGTGHPLVADFLSTAPPGTVSVTGVSWWRVDGDDLHRLLWLPLAD